MTLAPRVLLASFERTREDPRDQGIQGVQPDFSALSIHWGDALTGEGALDEAGRQLYDGGQIFYGSFINTVISFALIAFIVFLMVRSYNRHVRKVEEEAAAEEPAGPSEVELLTEIRDNLANRTD